MSLTERIYGKEATGKPAASSGERENLYAAAETPSLAKRIAQNKAQPTLYADAVREAGRTNNLYSSVAKAAANKARQTAAGNVLSGTPYADAAAQMKQGGTNNNFWHGVAGLAEKAWAGAREGLRTGMNEMGYRAQAAAPLNAADDAYYKAMWEQTTGQKTGVEIPKDTRTQEQRELDEYMGVGDLYSDAARAMQRATAKGYERLDKEGIKTAFKRDGTYQERVDQKYADLGPKWQQAMGIAGSVGNQMIPILGRIAGTAIGGPKAGEAAQSILFFNQASGAAIEEALNDGADWDKALTYGTVIGGIEAATEAAGDAAGKVLFKAGGKALPKEEFTRALIGTLTNNKAMRTTLTILGQMNGEGLEEVASDLVSPFAKSIYNGKTPGQNWMDEVTLQGLWESYLGGAISGGILSGLGGAVNNQFRAQNQLYADATVNTALQEARTSARENGLFDSRTREKIIDAGLEMQNVETNQRTAAAEAQQHIQMVSEAQKALRGDAGARERLLRMIESNNTAETQNAAEGVPGARRATIPPSAQGADTSLYTREAGSSVQNDMKGELANGQSTYQGRENRAYDLRTGGEGLRAEGRKGAVAGGQGEIRQGVGEYAQADLRQVTPAQLGIRNGGNEAVTLVDAQKLGGEAKSAADFITANGREAVAVRGAIQVGSGYANAYVENGKVYFRVDATDAAGKVISPKKLAQHELFHEYVNDEVLDRAADFIRESMTAEEFDAMKESYRTAYASIYDLESMSEAEIERLLREEIAADAYAGMNWFSTDTAVQEAIRAETERNAPAQRAEAQQDSTGPPRFSLNTYSEQQKANWSQSKKILVYENAEQLKSFVEKARADSGYVSKIYFGTVDGALAAEIMNETGYDLRGKNVTLRADNVRKIFKDHGQERTEAPRGQRPVTVEDFAKIPDVIGSPDSITEGDYFGKQAVEFKKVIDGSRITVFAVDSGGSSLDLYVQTMYAGKKKGSIADTANASALTQTPKTPAGTASFKSNIRSSAANSQEKSSGRASIVTLPDGKKYIQADRQVIFGNDPASWADQIEGYINRKIRGGEDVVLTTDSGDVLTITKDTAGKASFRNYVREANGRLRPLTDAEYETKLNAEAHIDELAKVSERTSNKAKPDEIGRTGTPIHGDLAKNGWYYRRAWFQDFDGKYYQVTISTADGASGVVVYNVGQIERRSLPSFNGSSDSVTETGARWGNASSENNIRSAEGNSQEKSSGRASMQVESREYAELRREYERRTKAWNEANGRNDESFPFASELRWITEAEKRMNEMKEAGATRKRRTVSNTRRDIMKLFSTDKANRRDMEQLINRQIGEMMDSGEITAAALDRMVGELLDAGSVVSSSKNSPWIDETYERIRSDLSGTKLYVSEKTWGDFSKDEAKLLRQRARKAGIALTRNENDVSPDVRNMELAENYGEQPFPTDIAASDMLRNIIDAAEKGENVKQTLSDRLWDETRTAGADREEAYNEAVNDLRSQAETILREFAEDNKITVTGTPNAPGRFTKAETAERSDFQITMRKAKDDPSGTVTVTNKKTGEKEQIYIADAQELSKTEMEAYGEKRIREIVKQEATEAERKEAEAYEAAKEETKRKRTYEPMQSVGEYTEKLVRMESALETADNAVMEEGKNRYEARISEEGGYVYAYVYKNGELLAKTKGKNRKKVPHWIANQIRIDFGERTVFHPALQERGDYDLDLKKAKKDGYPVMQKKNGERVQAVPFWTWVRSKDRGNYGLVVSRVANTTGPDGQGVMDVFYYNKKTGKGMIVPENAVSVYAVDGKYSDLYAEEKEAARMNDEAAETRRIEETEKLREAQKDGSPFEARENDTTATTILRTQSTSMGASTIFQQLISKEWARVKAQVTTTSPKIAEWEIQMDTNGVQYWADISLDGKKIKRIIEMKKNDAAQKAAEYVDEEANKAFTDANAERAARQAAEEQAEHDAKVAELLGEPDPVDIIFPSESKVADEPTAAEKAESRVAENVEKKTTAFLENASELWHGALRMLENAGDTVSRMSKATGNKSLEGYYFNAGAYSQRAGDWIAPKGARTDIDGKKLGKSLEDMLAPMRKDPEVYRQFNLYALHLHNIDRMKYDNTAELETIKKQLDAIENTFPELRNQPGYVEQMAGSDEKTKLTSEHAEMILAEMAEGNPPNVSSLAEAAQLLLYARRKQAGIMGQGMKPVFGYDVTAYDSQREVKRLEAEHPEFKEWMKEVKQYSDDLLDYRVQAGLDTRESVEAMKKRYPNYVPTLRVEGTNGKAARRARRSGGITVSDAIGRAVGSDAVLMPLHTALSRKTVAVMRNAGMNMLGREFLKEWSGENKAKISDYITNVSEYENSTTDQQYTDDYLYKPVKDNVFSVYDGGKLYEITMDEGLTVAMRAFEPDKFGGYAVAKGMKKLNDLFKALCTGYNPFFTARNAVRDWMDAGFYSTDTKTWEKMYWSAWNQIRTNGEIWQQYKALGGSYASLLDYTTGMTKQPKNAAARTVAKFEAISQAVEAAPRLAEFMTILANKGGSKTVDGVKTGEFTTSDYMEAMLGAADITTNFARGGTVAKALNKYAVPFLNPSIQGFSKFVRNAIETKSVKAAGSLILKAALAGILPTLLGELMYGDDEEWADIPPASKANYYLIKLGNGYWLKIPQGRAVAVLSTAGVYGMEKIKGNEVTFSDVFDVVKSNIAPTDIFNQNLATAWTQTKLRNPDNPGTTWYGGNIENERMQSLRPEDRYDENTDALSKLLGKTFHLSPKKINYLLDQYTGVIGDLLLPMLKPAAKAPLRILEPAYSAFTIDTTNTNVTTGRYYDLLDELKYDANDGDTAADVTRRYANHAGAEISDYYSQIREIQNDKDLNPWEKNELVRALKKQLIEREKEIISDAERYREAVENYMSANPELATDNAAAVAEFAEKYEITEDQAEDRMDAIVYREANREVFGAEYALRTYNSDVYDKARAAYAKGVSYDTYYDYYFATKDMHADKDENGKSISGSKKAKVVEYINSLDIPPEQKDALYIAAGYTEKSAKYQKWNGGGGSGGGRGGRTAKLKAPAAPKTAKITIPEVSTPKVSAKVSDIAKAADVGKLREAAKKTTRTAIKAGNRTIYIEDGSPLDYFLKTGKLPSTK